MFYATAARAAEGGQAQRDRVRILAMEKDGYEVYTVDNTHEQHLSVPGRHLYCNACSPRFMRELRGVFGADIQFDSVQIDYFRSPAGWFKTRWSMNFWQRTLPDLLKDQILRPRPASGSYGKTPSLVILPNQPGLESFLRSVDELTQIFEVWKLPNKQNPLYKASGLAQVEEALTSLRDKHTNTTECRDLDRTHPFLGLYPKANAFAGTKS